MTSSERPRQSYKEEAAAISRRLTDNFEDKDARLHLTECLSCREVLADSKDSNISTLAQNIRNGISCAG